MIGKKKKQQAELTLCGHCGAFYSGDGDLKLAQIHNGYNDKEKRFICRACRDRVEGRPGRGSLGVAELWMCRVCQALKPNKEGYVAVPYRWDESGLKGTALVCEPCAEKLGVADG